MSGPRDEIEPRPAVVSDVWHECGNCGGRSPCDALRKIVEGE